MPPLTILGSLLILIGWIWLIVLGFKKGGAIWGILVVFSSIIVGLLFCIVKRDGWIPWAIMFAGWCLIMFIVQPWKQGLAGAAY
jgi:hypothetical protein